MNELRRELARLLAETGTKRPPALRRSLREAYLYATDLPQAAGAEEKDAFLRRAKAAGWTALEENGWIQMDKCPEGPPETGGEAGPEALRCASLLRRHPEARQDSRREKRILIKTAEEGKAAREEACAALHREWAERLRKREGLPDLEEKWFKEEGTC